MRKKGSNPFTNSDSNKRYYTFDYFLRNKFGCKVFKAPIDAGFTCPNIDGKCSVGGCTYCSGRGSGDFAPPPTLSVAEQYEISAALMRKKWKDSKGIVYFQAHTNTYAPIEKLRSVYNEALRIEDAVGISIATRADCIDSEVAELLHELSEKTFLTVELGLQTVHDSTSERINRGHDYETFLKGYERVKDLFTCIHIINGLPGEDKEMMMETARKVARLHPNMLKIHLLHVLKNTQIEKEYERGLFDTLSLEEYVDITVSQIEIMPSDVILGRVTGDGERESLVAPLWSLKKLSVMNEIDKEFVKRESFQGKFGEFF